jgi:Domain of unknown function (DUF6899)
VPYVKRERRPFLDSGTPYCQGAGELNYVLTRACITYLHDHGVTYATFNDIIGALECAKLEMYRRRVSPYENLKIEENGDVYP